MFPDFLTAFRIAYVSNHIAARHTLTECSPLKYHHPLEQNLFDALNGSDSGVFVHWGVYESGKSTAVRETAWRLQEEAGRQVVVLHGHDFSWKKPGSVWLRHAIGIPVDTHEPLSTLFTKPSTTVIIDHADLLMRDMDNRATDTLELVRALMIESGESKKFNVLLVLNSWERVWELVDVGCTLVPGDAPARWTREQLESLFSTLSDTEIDSVGEGREKLLRFSTLSGTPGYLLYEARGDRISPKHAAMHDLEWRMGLKALYEDSLQANCGIGGRFPDKNGVYHHEDLAGPCR